MRDKYPVAIRYRFEKYPPFLQSHFERFAQTAQHLVQNTPLAIPSLPFGSTSRVSSGVLESGPDSSSDKEAVRLKAIESPNGTLLEHSYDPTGRLLETTYPDGVCLRYDWNDANQLTTVHLPDGYNITYQYGEEGLLSTVTYPLGLRFCYEYDGNGRLINRIYPDHKSVAHIYDRRGRLVQVLFMNSRFTYEWDEHGGLRRVLFSSGGEIHEFALSSNKLNIYLTVNHDNGMGESDFMSAFGVWTYSSEGRLREMMLPDGERLCIRPVRLPYREVFWNSLGQTVYQYDNDGVLSAVLHPNGMRTVYHRIPDTNDLYRVSINGVALYQYGRNGKLLKICDSDGQYCVFDYDRNGMITKMATAMGHIRLRHDDAGRLRVIASSSGLSGELLYGATDYPTSISLRGTVPDALVAVLAFASQVWQWMALKPSLRLEDRLLREV